MPMIKLSEEKKEKVLKAACFFVAFLILTSLTVLAYQIGSGYLNKSSQKKQQTETSQKEKEITLKSFLPSFEKDLSPKNILALGRVGDGYPGSNLTDTILIIHLEPSENKSVLISLPRDLLVKAPNSSRMVKINSLYYLVGIEGLKNKIEEITGLTINHYAIVDLVVVEEIISLVDGLNVYVPQEINDPYFPGHNYTYQPFYLSAGWRYLDGPNVLKYIRSRYTSPNGDFDRMARQQQIIRLLKQKVLSLNPLGNFMTYFKIAETSQNHIETDLTLKQMQSLWQTAKDTQIGQILSLVVDKKETHLVKGGQVSFGEQKTSVVFPKRGQGDYSEIKSYIEELIKKK